MLWGRNKEKKILKQIKKKKKLLDKINKFKDKAEVDANALKEEIEKMAKLVLKDGKLQRVEEGATETQKPVEQKPVEQKPVEQKPVAQQPVAQQPVAQHPQDVGMTQEEYEQMLYQKEMRRRAFEEQRRQEHLQAQQQLHQQQPQQQRMQSTQAIEVSIDLINGVSLKVLVNPETFESFVEEINTAIDNQSSIVVENKILNGRNIVMVSLD